MDDNKLQANINKYFPFIMEIRQRLFFLAAMFLVSGFMGFFFYEKIIGFLLKVFSLEGVNIVFTSPFQFINLSITTGVSVGLVLSFPVIIYQLLSFLKPALNKKEYRLIISLLPLSIILFVSGFVFGALIMKWQISIFLDKSTSLGIGNMLDISALLSVIVSTSALMGIAFQFPIVMTILLRLKVIKRKMLTKNRQWAYFASFCFAIFLPADSILADVLLSLPLVILFELTLLLDKLSSKKGA